VTPSSSVIRERLATLEPGGTPDRPIEVVTAALVEPKARAIPCPVCSASVRVDDHTERAIQGVALRLAHIYCPRCGTPASSTS
jgi:ribosomal protein S27AE